MSYADDLRHPKWQERRLRVLEQASFRCLRCKSAEHNLHAHHKVYLRGRKPWEYEDILLECLCDDCHLEAHADKDALDLLIAQQPTMWLPAITDAVLAFVKNELQDRIDEHLDFQRGPADEWITA